MTNMAARLLAVVVFLPLLGGNPVGLVKPIDPLEGAVLRVTTLAPDGPGSLRKALAADGPRLIVFEVGGVIDLGGKSLLVRKPHVVIAGQTAPDPGITLIKGGLVIETQDVVVQHLAVRPGDGAAGAIDAITVNRGHDVLIDHCSATWGIDENLSVSGPGDAAPSATSHDVTIRSCLIAEALSHAKHPKGEHSKGTLIHDNIRGVTIEGSLFAHNRERNPRLKGGVRAVIANNVIYNWGSACIGVGVRGNDEMLEPAEAVIVANTAIAGPDSRGKVFVKAVDPGARVFLRGNVTKLPLAGDGVVQLAAPPSWAPRVPDGAADAERVLRTVGSRPARRDPIDARIVQSVTRGDGRIIDSQEEVGGYPVRAATARALEVPVGAAARRKWLRQLAEDVER
jgi:Pectate lyase